MILPNMYMYSSLVVIDFTGTHILDVKIFDWIQEKSMELELGRWSK
jgi:hypothetical protein